MVDFFAECGRAFSPATLVSQLSRAHSFLPPFLSSCRTTTNPKSVKSALVHSTNDHSLPVMFNPRGSVHNDTITLIYGRINLMSLLTHLMAKP
jgi:hypothetical protein